MYIIDYLYFKVYLVFKCPYWHTALFLHIFCFKAPFETTQLICIFYICFRAAKEKAKAKADKTKVLNTVFSLSCIFCLGFQFKNVHVC